MRNFIVVGYAAVALSLAGPNAYADECASEPVQARGEQSMLTSVARIKAIGNWRIKVRRLAHLGPQFDNWKRAVDQVERCVDNNSSVVCTVIARPCRKDAG
ncbi:MAG: hypothetical protein ACK5JT_17020 [Hyphomicrobiaceae bacterium]